MSCSSLSRPLGNMTSHLPTISLNNELEQFQSLALEICAKEIYAAAESLSISTDPFNWSVGNVRSWIMWQMQQCNLPSIVLDYFNMTGIELCSLSEDDFKQRAPHCGEILFAQLDIWKTAASFAFKPSRPSDENIMDLLNLNQWSYSPASDQLPIAHIKCEPMDRAMIKMECMSPSMSTSSCASPESVGLPGFGCDRSFGENHTITSDYGSERAQSDDEISDDGSGVASPASVLSSSPSCPSSGASSSSTRSSSASHIHLWQFLKELLGQPQLYGSSIRWLERSKGIFKIEDSVKVARLWGKRKNRPAMNYDKLSRSIRQYYKKGIMKKTERSQRLVYQFCHPYAL